MNSLNRKKNAEASCKKLIAPFRVVYSIKRGGLPLRGRLALLLLATLALLNCDTLFDIVPPKIEIISPKADTAYFGTLPVELNVTDNGKIAKVEVFLDGESIYEFSKGPYKTDIDLDQINASTVTLKAVAYDKADNHAEASRDVTLTIGLRLTSPNGGEAWPEQSNQIITWESSGNVGGTVSLHYSVDGGTAWTQIVASTANDGSQAWTLPDLTVSEQACKIKVASTSTSFFDESDGNFTITGRDLALTAPNGGENWQEWSTQTITWTSSGEVGGYVSLHYSLDGGTTWGEITGSTANSGTYNWTLPDVSQDEIACRVKVASTTTSYFDISDNNFTITNRSPVLVGSFDTPGSATSVFVSGSYAYVADGYSGLQIVNVSNPASPTLAGSYNTPGYARRVFVSGGYAYVADGVSGLQIINVSNPASPTLAGAYDTPSDTRSVSVTGGYTYVADGGSGLQIINVSNPASPALAGSYETPSNAQGVFVSGAYAYMADGGSGLQIINVSNPASPALAGAYNTPIYAVGLFVTGGYAYVADLSGGLQVIDVSNPASPTLAGSYHTPDYDYAIDVAVTRGYAYVANNDAGMQIINISNPASPSLAGSYDTPGRAYGVFVSGSYAYVADHESGLLIFDISGLP